MDVATFWDQVRSALGLDEPQAAETVARAIQVLIVVLLTVGIAHWTGGWVRRAAMAGRVYAEVAALLSRATALAVYAIGATVVLAIVGASWTAIAAVLGAATFGISLALQDVGRGFVNGIYILVERPFRIGDHVRVGAVGRSRRRCWRPLDDVANGGGRPHHRPEYRRVFEHHRELVGRNGRSAEICRHRGSSGRLTEIQGAVIASLRGTPHLSHHAPVVEVIRSSPDGTDIEVTVEHDLGVRIDDQVIERLRSLFPEATVATKSSAGAL